MFLSTPFWLTQYAAAATVTYNFNAEFSGGQAPSGPAPWIVATFTDISPGDVRLTIGTSGLTGQENIDKKGIYFNFDPLLDVTKLHFASANGGAGTIAANTIDLGTNSFKADGDGLYDINLLYTAGSGFGRNLTSIYDITDPSATISASSFYFLSSPSGGHGPFYAAAHVQNTGGAGSGGSGWVAPVPLPAAGWLLLYGVGGVAIFNRRPKRTAPG
jgi:hypothetical protein